MRTEKAEGPQEPGNNRRGRPGARPKRASGGAVGFGNVMRDVKGQPRTAGDPAGTGNGGGGGQAQGQAPGQPNPGFDPSMLQGFLDPGAAAARAMGAVETVGQEANDASYGVRDASEAAQEQQSPGAQLQGSADTHLPTPIARMTPAALIETVLDESTKLAIERASQDLHIELEPESLGPLIVRLRKGPAGDLDITFTTRQGDAARVLEQGSELLRDRLFEAGFAQVSIDVSHDEALRLR